MSRQYRVDTIQKMERDSGRLYELLTRVGRLLQADERASGDLLPVQWHALFYLARCNRYKRSSLPPSPSTLGVTKGTSSQTLKALEEKELIEKLADAADGRVVRLALTAKGRRLVRPDDSSGGVSYGSP